MSSPETTGPDFDVTVQRSSGTAVVQVAGELDLVSVPTLAEVLRDLEPPCDRVILDLSGLTFIDSTGLRLAITEHRRAELDGFDFVLAGAREPILRVLRISGLDVALPMAPDVASALDASDTAADPRDAT
jgi:anti-sigma B factor antagonist